ncbi:MAG TPA: glycosyltransferase family 39 protein [Rhodopila sp.]
MTAERRMRSAAGISGRSVDEAALEPGLPTILLLLAGFVMIWAVYLSVTEAPVAIKHDMSEAYAWGQEFQLGYNQHPPFWSWICGAWFLLFPRTGWAFALLSSLNAGIGLLGAWMLIGDFVRGRTRMAAWVLLMVTPLYTFYAYKYNANIIFLSIWPWTLHTFMRSVRSGRAGDAVGFGACVGAAMMSKYYALILIATCFFALLGLPARRRYLTSAAPYISTAVAVVIFAPHAAWLLAHKAPPLRYLEHISDQRWHDVIDYALRTLGGAIGMNLGVVCVVGLVIWTARRDGLSWPVSETDRPPLGVLATLALAPLGLTLLGGLVLRTRTMSEMTIGTFPLLPLLVIELAGRWNKDRPLDTDRLCRIASRLAVALTLGAVMLSPAIAWERTFVSGHAMKIEPFQEAAAEATRLWHQQTSLPLAYVGGSMWYADAIAFYSSDRPHSFVFFDFDRDLWVTPEALAEHGLLSICIANDRDCLARTASFVTPGTTRTDVTLAHKFWGHVADPVHFVVTIIPPRT